MQEVTRGAYKYKAYSFRLHDGTVESLKRLRECSGISWNKLFYRMLENYSKAFSDIELLRIKRHLEDIYSSGGGDDVEEGILIKIEEHFGL